MVGKEVGWVPESKDERDQLQGEKELIQLDPKKGGGEDKERGKGGRIALATDGFFGGGHHGGGSWDATKGQMGGKKP